MKTLDIVRAWKDESYRRSLSTEQLAALPPNPAGLVELTDEDLKIAGGVSTVAPPATTAPMCTLATFLNWKACGCGLMTTAMNCTAWWVCIKPQFREQILRG
jgi:mersacidin/lichenicidin family type 2 lantibiotic